MPGERIAFDWVAGLGNPGEDYRLTRHNAGFWYVDALHPSGAEGFGRDKRLAVDAAKLSWGGRNVHLVKPSNFMNNSGRSLQAYGHYYKLDASKLLVAHDELDLPAGIVKVKRGGGHGGHNGLRDVISHLGTGDFWRLRIGIGHPGHKSAVTGYVLKRAPADQQRLIDDAVDLAVGESPTLIDGDITLATQTLHRHKPD